MPNQYEISLFNAIATHCVQVLDAIKTSESSIVYIPNHLKFIHMVNHHPPPHSLHSRIVTTYWYELAHKNRGIPAYRQNDIIQEIAKPLRNQKLVGRGGPGTRQACGLGDPEAITCSMFQSFQPWLSATSIICTSMFQEMICLA
jgi:hypothetical protein